MHFASKVTEEKTGLEAELIAESRVMLQCFDLAGKVCDMAEVSRDQHQGAIAKLMFLNVSKVMLG